MINDDSNQQLSLAYALIKKGGVMLEVRTVKSRYITISVMLSNVLKLTLLASSASKLHKENYSQPARTIEYALFRLVKESLPLIGMSKLADPFQALLTTLMVYYSLTSVMEALKSIG